VARARAGRSAADARTTPLNPLALLRLTLACAPAGGLPNRRVVEAVLHRVWRGCGVDANDPARLAALTAALAPGRDPAGAEVKAELRALTEAAVADGIFGVPTLVVDGRHFWGLDALPMLAAEDRKFEPPLFPRPCPPWHGT